MEKISDRIVSGDIITSFIILLILLIIIPFHLTVLFVYPSFPDWATITVELGTYVLIFFMILIHRSNLQDYQIDKIALWIIILSRTLFRTGTFSLVNMIYFLLGVILAAVYLRGYFSFKPQTGRIRRVFISIILAVVIQVILQIVLPIFIATAIINEFNLSQILPNWHGWPDLSVVLNGLIYNIFYVAVFEEIVYRGFLWGYLEKKGWGLTGILFFQAGLFWAAHLFYWNSSPYTLWVAVPIG